MPKRIKKVAQFDKGLVTALGEDSIPAGAASDCNNFLDLGDRIELVRGQLLLGDESLVLGKVYAARRAIAVDGSEVLFRKIATKIQVYDAPSETWDDALTGLPDEDMTMAVYRTPAGSFVWASSPNSGLYRCNVANPTSWHDFYDVAKNYKGYLTIQDNRMFVWQILQAETILRLSYIDNDFPYTEISNENVGTGNGILVTFTGSLDHPFVVGRSINITDGVEVFTDDGMGTLTGDDGGTGAVNYTTGAYSITFNAPVGGAVAILADYQHEAPATGGLADFTYSDPRTAGQGDFLPQWQNSKKIQTVLSYDGKFYCLHDENTWVLDLTADDTAATNKIYRERVGVPGHRAACATGDGIYYVDVGDKKIRLLTYDDIGSKVIPKSISDVLDLTDVVFDEDTCIFEFSDYILVACKSSTDVTYNDTVYIFNKKWKIWNVMDALVRDFEIFGGKLYGASSVNDNVYELFSGFDDDDSPIFGTWTSSNDTLDSEELKKTKKLLVAGEMAESQELIVEISYDNDDFEEVGRIEGTSGYVDLSAGTEYGVVLYDGDTLGSGATVTAYRYLRRFDIDTPPKFYRVRIRFRTEEIGYLNIRQYRHEDIRIKRMREPEKYRN